MSRTHYQRRVAWIVLATMVFGSQSWTAMAVSRQYTTVPSQTLAPATRSSLPSAPTTVPLSIRDAAVAAEGDAQKAQILANQKTAAFKIQWENFQAAVKKADLSALLIQPANADDKNKKGGFYEVSKHKKKFAKQKVTDQSSGGEMIDVRPCNQILGITLPKWAGQGFKTSDGKSFYSYAAAKSYTLNADSLSNPIVVGKTGKIESEKVPLHVTYDRCLNIKDMSAQLNFPKKFADTIAMNDAEQWEPLLKNYHGAVQEFNDTTSALLSADAKVSDLCAKMILDAEAKDPNLENVAFDAYGFWIASKWRQSFLANITAPMLPSETSILDNFQIAKIFKDLADGKVDTSDYRTSLSGIYNSADGYTTLLRLDRAFGFATAYAASLKTQDKLTKRVAKAVADKAAPAANTLTDSWVISNAVTSGGKDFTQTTNAMDVTAIPQAPVILDPAMAALSSRLTEVLFALLVPVVDHTKKSGVGSGWAVITHFAPEMDNYFFALKDQSKSFVVKNGGFDIYDKASGWHKMQIDWKQPLKTTKVGYGESGTSYNISNTEWLYKNDRRFADSYLSGHPISEVLSQTAKEQDTYSKAKLETLPQEYLMGLKNAFGVNALTMLQEHHEFPPTYYCSEYVGAVCYTSNEYKQLLTWKKNIAKFADYVEKGLQADKAVGYAVGTFSKQMHNFSSVAFLFHPISIGFGTCSVYETLFSPYGSLGYSCVDYVYPLLMLYQPDKPPNKISTLIQWVADQLMPVAHAEEYSTGITKEASTGGYGGTAAAIVGFIASFWGSSSSDGASGSPGTAKTANEIAEYNEKAAAANYNKAEQMESSEIKQIGASQKPIEKQLQAQGYKMGSCTNFADCMSEAYKVKKVTDTLPGVAFNGEGDLGISLGKDAENNLLAQRGYLLRQFQVIANNVNQLPNQDGSKPWHKLEYQKMYSLAKSYVVDELPYREELFEKYKDAYGIDPSKKEEYSKKLYEKYLASEKAPHGATARDIYEFVGSIKSLGLPVPPTTSSPEALTSMYVSYLKEKIGEEYSGYVAQTFNELGQKNADYAASVGAGVLEEKGANSILSQVMGTSIVSNEATMPSDLLMFMYSMRSLMSLWETPIK